MDLREFRWGGTACIDLAVHGDRWWAVVNALMNLGIFHKMWGNS
jgi:hypothetical protein